MKPRILVEPWVMEAIEAAAESRVLHRLYNDKNPFGLSVGKINLLKKFYEKATGKDAHKIKASDLRKRPGVYK